MIRKFVIGLLAVASAAAGVVSGRAGGAPVATVRAASGVGCPVLPVFAEGAAAPAIAAGRGLWAIAGGRLVSAAAGRSVPVPVGEGTVRHVATSAGFGTAYVADLAGDDEVVVVTPSGTRRLQEGDEVTHPAWSPSGDLAWATGDGVAVLRRRTGRILRLEAPPRAGTVFSPAFLSSDRLAAVVSAPPSRQVPEGASLDQLWVTRLGADGWRRVTDFHATDDRWSTIRTPIRFGGGLRFVRVTGRASATREPRYELWRYDHGRVARVSGLDGERYLAGSRSGRLVWNVPDPAAARLILEVEKAGALRTIGCGAVMADPIDAVDPDRRSGRGAHVPPRGDWPALDAPSRERTEEIAVIVGDFATAAEAEAVAADIRAAYPGARVDVTDSTTAPLAIGPGVFGALLHLPADADATAALSVFRDRLPQYGPNSWIVTP
jgi:hypothetical protein